MHHLLPFPVLQGPIGFQVLLSLLDKLRELLCLRLLVTLHRSHSPALQVLNLGLHLFDVALHRLDEALQLPHAFRFAQVGLVHLVQIHYGGVDDTLREKLPAGHHSQQDARCGYQFHGSVH